MDTEQVKFIRFEDLVYRYDETTDLLIEWLNLDKAKHTQKRKIFNPDISRKNTKVWQKFPEAEKEVAYISERLTEYLYSY